MQTVAGTLELEGAGRAEVTGQGSFASFTFSITANSVLFRVSITGL